MQPSAILKTGLLFTLCALLASPAAATVSPSAYQTAEYDFSYALDLIKAADAYARGLSGAGQIIAVFDSGVTAANADLQGRLISNGWNALTNKAGAFGDANGHGTFVTGILAADKNDYGMQGIAYNARILPIKIVNANGSITVSDSNMATAIRFALSHGARIFNNSWNSSATIFQVSKAQTNYWLAQELNAWRQAVNTNAIIVFAAGNDSKGNPGFYAAL